MRYRQLGRSGLFVSELCLGTMTFGGSEGNWGHIGTLQQADADALVKAALDAGVNFFDTANVYASGRSEEILGQSIVNLGVHRDDVVIATKGLGPMREGPNGRGASRKHILAAAKESLQRLRLDHVDLYQIHGVDPATPVEETMDALNTLVAHGHARYVGVSNWAAWQIAKAQGLAALKQLAPIISLQAYYTLAGRDLEREIAPMLLSEGVGLMVWSPLAGGLLSGKYDRNNEGGEGGRRAQFDFPPVNRDRAYAVVDVMRGIARGHATSVASVALAWLLAHEHVTSVIVGAKRPDQLADNLASVDVALTADDIAALDAVSALPPEYPGWMIARQGEYRTAMAKAGTHPPSR